MAYEEEVASIVASIWQSMLNLDALPTDHPFEVPMNECLSGSISITGDWKGSFLLKMPKSLAQKSAEVMFASEPGSNSEEEVRDALGELTNMVGGSFKSMMEGNCQLSLPSIIEGSVFRPGTEEVCRRTFETEGLPFEVTVFQGSK